MITVLFNLILVALDLYVWRGVVRRRPWWTIAARICAWALGGCVAAMLLAEDGFGVLRLAAWLTFGHGFLLLAVGGCLLTVQGRRDASRGRTAWGVAASIGALAVGAIAIWSFLVEPKRLVVEKVVIESSKIKEPLRIAVLADFQTDVIGDYEREVVRTLAGLGADLILMPGDYMQHHDLGVVATLWQQFTEVLRAEKLDARLGMFAVAGDCEQWYPWTLGFRDLPVTAWDRTTSTDVGPLRLTGLSYRDSADPNAHVARSDEFHVVFGHIPNFALGEVAADLLVAGHTHGGQVQMPFIGAIIWLCEVPRAWASGVTQLSGGRTLVVSRGTGMERGHAPRLRFLCRPEITLIELRPAARAPR